MTNDKARLENLDDSKLVDVVKNYRKYGYGYELRLAAISILHDRGITTEQLQLQGVFENKKYNHAQNVFLSFRKNSQAAFILYFIALFINILIPLAEWKSEESELILFILNWIVLIGYVIFLIKSFIHQHQFYKLTDRNYRDESTLLYVLIGMPLYFIVYFFIRSRMKEKMKEME